MKTTKYRTIAKKSETNKLRSGEMPMYNQPLVTDNE
jgi:hypothetical protein